MAVKISIKPEMDDEEDTLPPEQEMMDMESEEAPPAMTGKDGMAGYAEGNEDLNEGEPPAAPAAGAGDTALADVVPDANPDLEGRIAALEAQLASAKKEAEQSPSPTADTGSPTAAAPSGSEWDAFEADYPDIAGPIRRLIEARTERYGTDLQAVHTRIFEEAMDAARPDWRDLREDPSFSRWIQSNPEQQQAAQVPGVRAALKVLAAYDASRKSQDVTAKRADRLKAAEATPAKGGRAPSLSDSLDGWAAE